MSDLIPSCSFCSEKPIVAMAGAVRLRFCKKHHNEYIRIGDTWDSMGPLVSEIMLSRYSNVERWAK